MLQILLVTFTGMAFGVYSNYGLSIEQWGITILIGSFALVVNLLLKLLPIARGDSHSGSAIGSNTKIADRRNSSNLSNFKKV